MTNKLVKYLQSQRAKTRIGTSSRCIQWLCKKHPECKGERYIANGRCVGCHRVKMIAKRARKRLEVEGFREIERQKQMERLARPGYREELKRRRELPKTRKRLAAYRKEYHQRDEVKSAHASRQRLRAARMVRATPPWADKKKILALYTKARRLGKTVDHIVPLVHPLVCGLHVHNNLRIISRAANTAKSNKWVQPCQE